LGRWNFCIGHLADAVVREIVSVRAVLLDDLPLPELVEWRHETICVTGAGLDQQLESEGASDRRRQARCLPCFFRKLREPGTDERLHFWRQPTRVFGRALRGKRPGDRCRIARYQA